MSDVNDTKVDEGKAPEAKAEERKAAPSDGLPPEFDGMTKEEIKKAVQTVGSLNARYGNDPVFKEVFDKAWAGKFDEIKVGKQEEESDEDVDPKEVRSAIAELQKIKGQLAQFQDIYGTEKIIDARDRVNSGYDAAFARMAEARGIERGSEAYDFLYSKTVDEGKMIAKKYGLVDQNTNQVDILKKFDEAFIKDAFERSMTKFKNAGFEDAWKRKQEAIKSENLKKAETDEYADLLKPEKLKTLSDRARAIEKGLERKFGRNWKRDLSIV